MAQGQGFGFGLGKIKELQDAFQKAQQVQQGAKVLQEELENIARRTGKYGNSRPE